MFIWSYACIAWYTLAELWMMCLFSSSCSTCICDNKRFWTLNFWKHAVWFVYGKYWMGYALWFEYIECVMPCGIWVWHSSIQVCAVVFVQQILIKSCGYSMCRKGNWLIYWAWLTVAYIHRHWSESAVAWLLPWAWKLACSYVAHYIGHTLLCACIEWDMSCVLWIWYALTQWGRVTHFCISKLISIGSDNGLSPGRRQAIIWTNAGILVIGTNFSEILIKIHTFWFKKMHLKMLSRKRQPFCLSLNVLNSSLPCGVWAWHVLNKFFLCFRHVDKVMPFDVWSRHVLNEESSVACMYGMSWMRHTLVQIMVWCWTGNKPFWEKKCSARTRERGLFH